MKVGDRIETIFKKSFEVTEGPDVEDDGIERKIRIQLVAGDQWCIYESSNWVDSPEPADAIKTGPFDYMTANEAAFGKKRATRARARPRKARKMRMRSNRHFNSWVERDELAHRFRQAARIGTPSSDPTTSHRANNGSSIMSPILPVTELVDSWVHTPPRAPPSLISSDREATSDHTSSGIHTPIQPVTPESSPVRSVEDSYDMQLEALKGFYNQALPQMATPTVERPLPYRKYQDQDTMQSVLPQRPGSVMRASPTLGSQSPPRRIQRQKSESRVVKSEARVNLKNIPEFKPPPPLVISPCRKEVHDKMPGLDWH